MRWVASFVSQRSAAVRLDGETGATVQIQSGLPQGSPTSPILFMLFMQPLFSLGSRDRKRARFGYADDISLLMESPVPPVSFRTFATQAHCGLAPKPWTATMLHLISEYTDIRHDVDLTVDESTRQEILQDRKNEDGRP
jgi:Reverse transcriptase (RNA-dependent DNA polymerase)